MVRLPVKSLMRFQYLSKHWSSLILSKDFGERHISHQQKTQDPKLLFVCDDLVDRAEDSLYLETMALETTSVSLEDTQSLEFEGFKGYLDNGLVCIYGLTKAVEVINPITTVFVALPLAKIQRLLIEYPDKSDPVPFISFTRFGFGKDYVTDDIN